MAMSKSTNSRVLSCRKRRTAFSSVWSVSRARSLGWTRVWWGLIILVPPPAVCTRPSSGLPLCTPGGLLYRNHACAGQRRGHAPFLKRWQLSRIYGATRRFRCLGGIARSFGHVVRIITLFRVRSILQSCPCTGRH